MNTQNEILQSFILTKEQTRLLFSLEYRLVRNNLNNIEKQEPRMAGAKWLTAWTDSTNGYLKTIYKDDKCAIVAADKLVLQQIMVENEAIKNTHNRLPLYLILLECCLFNPYFDFKDPNITEKDIKACKYDKKIHISECKKIASSLGISEDFVDKFIEGYQSAINRITKKWQKLLIGGLIGAVLLAVTAGLAATFIAPFFAAAGLTGAAAVSSGLAALGGGAIAAGGFGMAGGLAVLVGGGALLGGTAGSGIAMTLVENPDLTLSQAARNEVFIEEVLFKYLKDIETIQQILYKQQETISALKTKIANLKLSNENNKEKIKKLEESLKILERAFDLGSNLNE